eukprot:TRINITY_DN5485_c0_g1_i1.p1 TRINITY_DN5485_c0_g1~~TRINITY_DN5485_c0_g1_i1.p1  ORF type:complete len:763 (-),score=126.03 TRINITY_DN5485_c0_g1_i1:201-2489(-)
MRGISMATTTTTTTTLSDEVVDELEVLKSVYGDDYIVINGKYHHFSLSLLLPGAVSIEVPSECGSSFLLRHLPHLHVYVELDASYPSIGPPMVRVESCWLGDGGVVNVVDVLVEQCTTMWRELGGEVMLFQYLQWLVTETVPTVVASLATRHADEDDGDNGGGVDDIVRLPLVELLFGAEDQQLRRDLQSSIKMCKALMGGNSIGGLTLTQSSGGNGEEENKAVVVPAQGGRRPLLFLSSSGQLMLTPPATPSLMNASGNASDASTPDDGDLNMACDLDVNAEFPSSDSGSAPSHQCTEEGTPCPMTKDGTAPATMTTTTAKTTTTTTTSTTTPTPRTAASSTSLSKAEQFLMGLSASATSDLVDVSLRLSASISGISDGDTKGRRLGRLRIARIIEVMRELKACHHQKHVDEYLLTFPHECAICFDALTTPEDAIDASLMPCEHVAVCVECMKEYAVSLMESGRADVIACSDPSCKELIPPSLVHKVLNDEELSAKYTRLASQRAVERAQNKCWCPRCGSAANVEDATLGICVECRFSFCLKCRHAWHYHECEFSFLHDDDVGAGQPDSKDCDSDAGDVEIGANIERKIEERKSVHLLIIMMRKNAMRPCPHCRTLTQKSSGCNCMHCYNCGKAFCFKCGKAINGYDHFGPGSCQLFPDGNDDTGAMFEDNGGIDEGLLGHADLDGTVKPCPMCLSPIAKSSDLNRVCCFICETYFCFRCLLPIAEDEHFLGMKNPSAWACRRMTNQRYDRRTPWPKGFEI